MAAGSALEPAALILTVELDGESFARLDELRRRHYPPERNLVPAHVTLFGRLPADHAREFKALLRQVATGRKPTELELGSAKAMETGVAIFLRSPRLTALREALAAEWWPWLADRDRAGFRPHVTIQNGVSAAEARETQQSIAATFRLRKARGVGLHLWRYRDGPWEHVQLFPFR
jgi:2'-5' RNA ligase